MRARPGEGVGVTLVPDFTKRPSQLCHSEKLTHLGSRARGSGVTRYCQCMENQPQRALVLIQARRSITLLRLRADDEFSHVTATIRRIIAVRLIEDNDQQTILL